MFIKSQLNDKESIITEHESKIKDQSKEITKLVDKIEQSQKYNEEMEYNFNIQRQESDEKISSTQNDLFNSQSLLKERGKQLEELMKTIDVLKSETNVRESTAIDASQSMSVRNSIESAKNINYATLDQDRLITHLYNLSAEVCAFSRIEGNYERRLNESQSQLDKLQND